MAQNEGIVSKAKHFAKPLQKNYSKAVIKDFYSVRHLPLLTYSSGETVGFLHDLIIHPDTGKIEALWVLPTQLPIPYAIVDFADILEWKRNLYVRNEGVLAEPGEILRLNSILERGVKFLKNKVMSENGVFLGKVANLDFDTRQGVLKNIYVQKGFLGFSWGRRVFDWNGILEVTPDFIVVKEIEPGKVEETEESLNADY